MRAWYNGSTSASQAEDEGSIPFARTRIKQKWGSPHFLFFFFVLFHIRNQIQVKFVFFLNGFYNFFIGIFLNRFF